ncbi:MAG: OadG family protein [Bacteroides sp.]|jgi:Na+-transporting methylmalonyl-CoA/oxaloacetate decarboxylase gamma subunit|nr:OadG family protein [Bacteroides sp.]
MMMSVMNLSFPVILAAQATGRAAAEALDDADKFVHEDPYGLIMALLGLSIVFSALVLIYVVISNSRVLFTSSFRQKFKSFFMLKKSEKAVAKIPVEAQDELSGEVNAAIAAAIHLYRSELHDFEDTVLTIKKVSRTYSPWSSKIYGLRNPLGQ